MIRKMASSQEAFLGTCTPLLARMIDTVPRGVTLSQVITPISVKPDNIFIAVEESSSMLVSGDIRVGPMPSDLDPVQDL